jgi:hypothetical protein
MIYIARYINITTHFTCIFYRFISGLVIYSKLKILQTNSVDVNYADQVLIKIKEANEKWDFLNSDSQISKKVRNVAFSEPLVSKIKLEDPEMADELRVARVGEYNFVQRSADQDRYNRLLGPVFQPEHRDKIRSYIAELNSRVI